MTNKDRLTNEKLNQLFDSPFNLVNYVIKQAKIRIAKGDVRSSNAAIEALVLLEKEGVQADYIEEDTEHVSTPTTEKKREGGTSGRRKDPSAYTWSDVK
ncbi:hypothetical protein [Chlamydia psittaci]|uniref:hypothetical protein n=1 Tax=Chlamydia psittaci TaxID=83554 RepID=UPI00027E1661|nr:hypothetical protein [Chlamydia psittaci]EPJ25849.1 hypothetical protein CP09DC77_0032 [Chlamydia psittaci 09DC77]EPJ30961.1 hypothetical protein CP09DC78_0029 [Chlamydia psittaci 09DC78]EPL00909.1 hypothetical protein CP09DC79_0834 [Chlamydia psittaci 09DC79]AFS21472.1 hypothetical protein B599_0701 [Chlamydia psittaci MN]AFS27147.1 hypothetical protein B711_0754 [Chlamydia psittaci CP3]